VPSGRASFRARSQSTKARTTVFRHIQVGNRRNPAEGRVGVGVLAVAPDEPVDAIGVGPVGLDRDGVKTLLLDQSPGDLGPLAVELAGPVRGLDQQDESGVADPIQQEV
jgi:hypothetical protein